MHSLAGRYPQTISFFEARMFQQTRPPELACVRHPRVRGQQIPIAPIDYLQPLQCRL